MNKSNKKIISTTLYGNKDIYNYGLLLNDALNKLILPDWILRVYIDNTTNMNFISKVKNNNNIETSINPIDKNKKFYYEPWKDFYNVSYNNDIIIISPHNNYNSYAKVMKIFKKDWEFL